MAGRPDSSPFYEPPGNGNLSRGEKLKLMVSWSIEPPEWARSSMRARTAVVVSRLCFLVMVLWIAFLLFMIVWKA